MARVLVVDDEESIRITVSEFIKEDGHEVNTVADATQALRLMEEQDFDVIVTDIIMPKIRGVKLLKSIHEVSQEIQVVMITGEPSADTAAQAVRAGAFDYLAKPISREAIKEVVLKAAKTKALLDEKKRLEQDNLMYQEHLEELVKERTTALQESERKYRGLFENARDVVITLDLKGNVTTVNKAAAEYGFSRDDIVRKNMLRFVAKRYWPRLLKELAQIVQGNPIQGEIQLTTPKGRKLVEYKSNPIRRGKKVVGLQGILRDVTERKKAEEELRQSFERLQKTLEGTVHALASAVEMRDPYTAGHQRRVTQLVCAIAKEMELPNEQIEGIRAAGLMHDIGKISIPAEVLSKPSKLTDTEFDLIKGHSQAGYEILKNIKFPWPIEQIVLQHHERLDGSGYPQGIKGEEIMVEARVLGVADVVEAMASHRPYRPALGIDKALEEIEKNKGTLYDPKAVDVCVRLFSQGRFKFQSQ